MLGHYKPVFKNIAILARHRKEFGRASSINVGLMMPHNLAASPSWIVWPGHLFSIATPRFLCPTSATFVRMLDQFTPSENAITLTRANGGIDALKMRWGTVEFYTTHSTSGIWGRFRFWLMSKAAKLSGARIGAAWRTCTNLGMLSLKRLSTIAAYVFLDGHRPSLPYNKAIISRTGE